MRNRSVSESTLGNVAVAFMSAEPSLANAPLAALATAVHVSDPVSKYSAVICDASSARSPMATLVARTLIVSCVGPAATYVPAHWACVREGDVKEQSVPGCNEPLPPVCPTEATIGFWKATIATQR